MTRQTITELYNEMKEIMNSHQGLKEFMMKTYNCGTIPNRKMRRQELLHYLELVNEHKTQFGNKNQ